MINQAPDRADHDVDTYGHVVCDQCKGDGCLTCHAPDNTSDTKQYTEEDYIRILGQDKFLFLKDILMREKNPKSKPNPSQMLHGVDDTSSPPKDNVDDKPKAKQQQTETKLDLFFASLPKPIEDKLQRAVDIGALPDNKRDLLLRNWPDIYRRTRIPLQYFAVSIKEVCTKQEIDWFRGLSGGINATPFLIFCGDDAPASDISHKMLTLAAASWRLYHSGASRSMVDLVDSNDQYLDGLSLLAVRDFFTGTKTLYPNDYRKAFDFLVWRAGKNKASVLYVSSLASAKKMLPMDIYGDMMANGLVVTTSE